MVGPFLVTLREGLEAALVIGIILAFLVKTNGRNGFRPVWVGTGLAVGVSLLVGWMVYQFMGELGDPAEAIFEGSALFLAVAVLTWMIFWMRKQSSNIKNEMQKKVNTVLARGSAIGLALIAFFAVVREGIETVLFLFAANSVSDSKVVFLVGGVAGLITAVLIGYIIYKNSTKLNLNKFFYFTGLILIIFAAGMLAQGVHEFNEIGIIPSVIEHVWDVNKMLPETSMVGRFITALFGYNANPSLTEVIAYITFLFPVLAFYVRSSMNFVKPASLLKKKVDMARVNN